MYRFVAVMHLCSEVHYLVSSRLLFVFNCTVELVVLGLLFSTFNCSFLEGHQEDRTRSDI